MNQNGVTMTSATPNCGKDHPCVLAWQWQAVAELNPGPHGPRPGHQSSVMRFIGCNVNNTLPKV